MSVRQGFGHFRPNSIFEWPDMQQTGSHVFSSDILVQAPVHVVYNALINVQGNFEHLTSTASGLKMLSANEFAGRGKSLFLRDVLAFKVQETKVGSWFLYSTLRTRQPNITTSIKSSTLVSRRGFCVPARPTDGEYYISIYSIALRRSVGWFCGIDAQKAPFVPVQCP